MNIGQLIASLGVDTSGLFLAQKEMEKLKKTTEDSTAAMNKNLKEVGKTMMDVGKKMTLFITTPILAAGAAAFKMASDYNESLNKVQVAFGRNSKEVEAWSQTTLKSIGLSNSSALEMSSLFGDMSTSMGLNTGQAAKMSMSLVQLAGDLASFKNIGIDQAQTSLAGVFTGETESLKRLGIVMTETNIQQFAYTQGITKKVEQLSQAEKVMLRYNYIMSVTKNSQGDFTRTSEGAANQMRTFKESLTEMGVVFGQIILPFITKVITKINEWMQWITQLDSSTKKWIIGILGVTAAVGPLLLGLGFLIANVFPLIITGGTAVIGMLNSLKIAMLTNPITAFAVAIGAVTAYMISLWVSTDRQSTAVKTLNSINATASQAYAEQKVKIDELLRVAQSENTTLAQKEKAIRAIQDIAPEYLVGINAETLATGQAKGMIDQYIESLKSKATAMAAQEMLVDLEKKRLAAVASGQDKELSFGQKSWALQKSIATLTKYSTVAAEMAAENATYNNQVYLDQKNAILGVLDKQVQKEKALGNKIGTIGEVEVFGKTKTATAFDPEKMNAVADIMKKVSEGEKSISVLSKVFNRDMSATGVVFDVTEDKIKLYSEAIKQLSGIVGAGDPVLKSYIDKLNKLQPMAGPIMKKYSTGGTATIEGKNQVTSSVVGILNTPIKGLGTGAYAGSAGKGMSASKTAAEAQVAQDKLNQVANATAFYGQQAQQVIGSYTALVQAQTSKQLDMVDKVAKAQGKSAAWVAKEKERIQAESNRKQKAAAIAEAMINIAIGVTKAIAQGGVLGIITGAVVMAAGMMQIATINAQKMANGGIVPGGYSNDTYPALLTSGEMVTPPGKLPNVGARGATEFRQIRLNIKGRDLEYIFQEQEKLQNAY